jgi:formate hydrogenlyase subunit 6/NADH:ubiquinone oxidoreductase subunit I
MQKGTNNTYFGNLKEGLKSTLKGLKLSIRHFNNARTSIQASNISDDTYFANNNGAVTLQYPHEVIAVPDHGRYRLFNEMDDCIVCDKCAKVCPVDCIEIEPIKSSELIGNASDGSPIRLYAAKFDIDMAKCCFCGLCTTVCPTECLTMTKAYDFAEFDVKDFNYHYANISPEQALEKKRNYEQFVAEKEALKAVKIIEPTNENSETVKEKPVFKPSFRPKVSSNSESNDGHTAENKQKTEETPKARPIFRPAVKAVDNIEKKDIEDKIESVEVPKPRPIFRPAVKPMENIENKAIEDKNESVEAPKPRPIFRPVVKKTDSE